MTNFLSQFFYRKIHQTRFLKSVVAFFTLSFFLLSMLSLNAQNYSTKSGRAVKFYKEGSKQNNLLNYAEAEANLLKAIYIDSAFLEAYMLLGDVYSASGKFAKATEVYQNVIDLNPEKYPEVFFFAGLAYYKLENYEKVIQHLTVFLSKSTKSAAREKRTLYLTECSHFALDAKKNPVSFKPVNLGENVNTTYDEYINAIRSDGLVLYFTGRDGKNSEKGGDDFYFSTRTDISHPWGKSQKVGPPVNTPGDEGALTITPDGRYLLFAGCHWQDGFGSCDIYASRISGTEIGNPVNLGSVINTPKWESQPSLSTDGRTLYFSGIRQGGCGNSDLWYSYLQDNGEWSIPQNLGEIINTEGSEMAPFIHPDGQTLYFSSDYQIGMGGMDLYVSKKDSTGNWGKPVNLGYPVNTAGDEINVVVSAAGDKAWISADKYGGYGGFDIFEFDLPPNVRPIPSTYVRGFVFDAKTQQPLEAYFSLIDLETGNEIVRSFSDKSSGEFLVCIPANRNYALNVSKEKYLFHSENFALEGSSNLLNPFQLNIALNPVVAGETMILRNVFFNTDQYSLKEESKVELKKLLDFIHQNPALTFEISGHTDNIGSVEYNNQLSEYRAKAVYDFLIKNNVEPVRLTFKGYGFSKPLCENDTLEGMAKNRRTEIKILDTTKQ